jgi:hypothetical protein
MFLWRSLEPWKLAAFLARLAPARTNGDNRAVSPAKPAVSEAAPGSSAPASRLSTGR